MIRVLLTEIVQKGKIEIKEGTTAVNNEEEEEEEQIIAVEWKK